jgi:hypothetical protein
MERAHRLPGMGACAAGVGTTTEGTATSLNLPTYLPSHQGPLSSRQHCLSAVIEAALTIGSAERRRSWTRAAGTWPSA